MLDGVFRSILAMLNITPEEASDMAHKVVHSIDNMDARLARIEAALGIQPEEGAENGNQHNAIGLVDSPENGGGPVS